MKFRLSLLALSILPSFAFAELQFSQQSSMELDGGLTKQDVRQALKKAQKGQQKMLRIDEGGAITFAASEQFWSTTIYPNPGNVKPHDQVAYSVEDDHSLRLMMITFSS